MSRLTTLGCSEDDVELGLEVTDLKANVGKGKVEDGEE